MGLDSYTSLVLYEEEVVYAHNCRAWAEAPPSLHRLELRHGKCRFSEVAGYELRLAALRVAVAPKPPPTGVHITSAV